MLSDALDSPRSVVCHGEACLHANVVAGHRELTKTQRIHQRQHEIPPGVPVLQPASEQQERRPSSADELMEIQISGWNDVTIKNVGKAVKKFWNVVR